MPISVPKIFKAELENAARSVRNGVYMGAGADLYAHIRDYLIKRDVPHQVHRNESTVPGDHAYWKPQG